MKFNRNKYLQLDREFESNIQFLRQQNDRVLEVNYSIRRKKEELGQANTTLADLERTGGRNPRAHQALVKEWQDRITLLETQIADSELWVKTLTADREAMDQRNQALGSILFNFRRFLQEHHVEDPAAQVIA